MLGGRDAVLACEELALRARARPGRRRCARRRCSCASRRGRPRRARAVGERAGLGRGWTSCAGARKVGAAANAALQGGLDGDQTEVVRRGAGRIEAALRARTPRAVTGQRREERVRSPHVTCTPSGRLTARRAPLELVHDVALELHRRARRPAASGPG